VLYAGIFSLAALSAVPLGISVRIYFAFAICATAGAICYGLLIRYFWLPELTPRRILGISLGCLIATLLALLLENLSGLTVLWALAAIWWCAFSSGLWTVGRTDALRPHADA
jgi:hypothetical protein